MQLFQCGGWTIYETGSKNVPWTGLDDKIEIAFIAGTNDGTFPSTVSGKAECSHPQGIQLASEWIVTQ